VATSRRHGGFGGLGGLGGLGGGFGGVGGDGVIGGKGVVGLDSDSLLEDFIPPLDRLGNFLGRCRFIPIPRREMTESRAFDCKGA